jgi:hypothetical protein
VPTNPSKRGAGGPRDQIAPEAFEDYDDVSADAVKSIQRRADKVLKKGKWVVVDGYVDKE